MVCLNSDHFIAFCQTLQCHDLLVQSITTEKHRVFFSTLKHLWVVIEKHPRNYSKLFCLWVVFFSVASFGWKQKRSADMIAHRQLFPFFRANYGTMFFLKVDWKIEINHWCTCSSLNQLKATQYLVLASCLYLILNCS